MSGWFKQLFGAIEPLLPGMVLAGLFILFVVGARVALRGDKRLTDRLRVPAASCAATGAARGGGAGREP